MEEESKVCIEIDKKEISERIMGVISDELSKSVKESFTNNNLEKFNTISLGNVKMGRIFKNGKVDNTEFIYAFTDDNTTINKIEILIINQKPKIRFSTNWYIGTENLLDLISIVKEIEKEVKENADNKNHIIEDN